MGGEASAHWARRREEGIEVGQQCLDAEAAKTIIQIFMKVR